MQLASKPGSGTAVKGCGLGQRCFLAISAAQMIEVCRTALFRAKELNSTSSRDELCHSKQGLKHRDWLRVTNGRPVITAHLCVGLSHLYRALLCSFLLTSNGKKWPNCRQFSTSAELSRNFGSVLMVPKCLGSKASVHLALHVAFLQRLQCSHCKRCISYGNSVCPSVCLSVHLSVCLSVTRRYCVKTAARSMVQFAPLDSKMYKPKSIPQRRPLPPEILAQSDLPPLEAASFDTFCLVAPQP